MEFGLFELWDEMGWIPKGVVILLFLMSVGSFTVAIYRYLFLKKADVQSLTFSDFATEQFGKGNLSAVIQASQEKEYERSHIGQVVVAGLKEFMSGVGDSKDAVQNVVRSLDQAIERQRLELNNYMGILATTASTAPYIGLFGTVFGIIHAFEKMAEEGGGGIETVAGGIAEALYATALGLFVAIFAVWFYNYLHSRIETFDVEMSNAKLDVINYVDKNRSKAGLAASKGTVAGGAA